MNVAQIYCSYTLGGAELQMFEITKLLYNKGINVVLCCPFKSKLYFKALNEKIPVENLNIIGSLDFVGIARLYKIIQQYKINVVHINQGKLLWPLAILKILLKDKIKIVFHRRTTIPLKKMSYWTLKYMDAIFADSTAVKLTLLKAGVSEEKISVIYPGIDLNRFKIDMTTEEMKKKYGLENNFVVGCIAAMNPPEGKGQKYLISAIAIISSIFSDIRLLLVGDGKLRKKLENFVEKLRVGNYVIFTGFQEKVEEYISAMDILCLPSVGEESFGVVLIEAQAMGKPVIASNVGGIKEALIDGETGYIIEPRNVVQLVEIILKLLYDRNLYKKMSLKCYEWVRENFDIIKVVEKIEQIYNRIF
ncbi:MAG: glycosyltransferase family 4 protein [Endomicrobia bacterium]|nr:glycosyltransferase family 4 protein [Endomicrobiia bacterium]MCX7941184.1 glycosyltransferase family 4 protein [Endomicrobiia bacterium]MDW8056216.1 glycosyltransferase family 4 protein [Elusimicrobiota bacterium]